MPKYNYKCLVCNRDYYEIRLSEQPQWYTKCSDCNQEFTFISEEPSS